MAKPNFRFSTRELAAGIQRELMAEHRKAERAMKNAGAFLQGECRDRAPKDESHLERVITYEVVEYAKSFAAVIYVPENSEASKYAIPMHENTYNLGEKSLRKMAKNGVEVGPGYIIRGIDDNRRDIRDIIISIMKV